MQCEDLKLASFPSKSSTFSCLPIAANTIPILLVSRLAERDFFETSLSFLPPGASQWPSPVNTFLFSHFFSALSLPVYFPAHRFYPGVCSCPSPSSSQPGCQSPSFSPFARALLPAPWPLHILCWLTQRCPSHLAPMFPLEGLSHWHTQG